MSICIYPVRPEQLVRLGARTALAPLAPFLGPRYHRAPWGLNRAPLHHRTEPHFPPRLANVHLGQDATAPPAVDAPERITYAINIDHTFTGDQTYAASTPALPAPCTIESVYFRTIFASVSEFALLQLLLLDTPATGLIDNDLGEHLLIARGSTINAPPRQAKLSWGLTIKASLAAIADTAYLFQPLGRLVTEPGKYLALALRRLDNDFTIFGNAVITVQRHQAR